MQASDGVGYRSGHPLGSGSDSNRAPIAYKRRRCEQRQEAFTLVGIKAWYGRIDDGLKSEILLYLTTFLLTVALLFVVLQLWRANLRVPLYVGGGDAVYYQGIMAKPLATQWWYLQNSSLGAPGSMQLRDFPTGTDSFLFLMMKFIAVVVRDSAATVNLFYLLTYPLAALSMLFAARYLRLRRPLAVAVALLFAFAPYHLWRHEGHLMLSAYFMLPIGLVIALRIDRLLDPVTAKGKKVREARGWGVILKDPFFVFACAFAVISAGTGIYYAMFWVFTLVVIAARRAIMNHRWTPFVVPLLLCVVLFLSILALSSPTLIYQHLNGKNPLATERTSVDAEVFALRPVQLLLPMAGHRIPSWAAEAQRYSDFLRNNISPVLDNESRIAALGVIASIGFVFLIGWSVLGMGAFASESWSKYRLGDLAAVNLIMLLLGTVGGIGYIIADRITPLLRGYNRVSIAIAMVSLLAVGAVIDRSIGRTHAPASRATRLAVAVAVLLVAFGTFDQTTPVLVPAYDSNKAVTAEQRRFAASVQNLLPRGSMVFQLPYIPFPGAGRGLPNGVGDYDHLVPYIYSDGLRWSFGAMKGRDTAAWQSNVAAMPAAQMIERLKNAGFSAIYVDRLAYDSSGTQAITDLTAALGNPEVQSADGRMLLWRIKK